MKFTGLIAGAAAVSTVFAYPGMGNMMGEIATLSKVKRDTPDPPAEMIGDLIKGNTSATGTLVKMCLNGEIDCYDDSNKTYVPPGPLGSPACRKDTCCVWDYLGKELVKFYLHKNGRCNQHARAAIRLGFHDAGAWSKKTGYGGADGSMLLSRDEINRPENNGLQSVRLKALELLFQYGIFGVGAADLVQFMANVATVTCPLGPRVRVFVGRESSPRSPTGLLPDVNSNAKTLIDLFADKTITPEGLVALVGAHTSSNQFFVNIKKAGAPQDSTPGIWDVSFYNETMGSKTDPKVFKFPSDVVLSGDATSGPFWKNFMDPVNGQEDWNEEFSKAYVRLSLLGVNKINQLTECTKVQPNQLKVFPPPPQSKTDSNKNLDDGDKTGPMRNENFNGNDWMHGTS